MIEKLLTLLSGNVLLVRKAIQDENKTLSDKIESLQQENKQAIENVAEGMTSLSKSFETLAETIKARPPIEVKVPDISVSAPIIPEIKLPDIKVTVPNVIVPDIKIPPIKVPAPQVTLSPKITVTPTPVSFPKEMTVSGLAEGLKKLLEAFKTAPETTAYTQDNPMPVAFIDRKGRRYDLVHLGGGGSKAGGGASPSEIADKVLKTAVISLSATGTVVSAIAGRRIKVFSAKVVCSASLSIGFRDGASNMLEGMQGYVGNGGYIENILPPAFLFATSAGNSLDLVITGTGTVTGRVTYWDEDKV